MSLSLTIVKLYSMDLLFSARTLLITVDDRYELYIDGIKQEGLPNTLYYYEEVGTVKIGAHARIIAVKGINLRGNCGIIASSTDGSIFTGAHWKVTSDPVDHDKWTQLDFNDDGWQHAIEEDPRLNRSEWDPNRFAISPKAKMIWSSDRGEQSIVYARLRI